MIGLSARLTIHVDQFPQPSGVVNIPFGRVQAHDCLPGEVRAECVFAPLGAFQIRSQIGLVKLTPDLGLYSDGQFVIGPILHVTYVPFQVRVGNILSGCPVFRSVSSMRP